jgi:hypothetical protein
MSSMQVHFHPTPDEDTAAAILAAIACHLDSLPAASDELPPAPAWRIAARLAAQGQPPVPGASQPAWGGAERSGRAARWSSGIVGM